MLRHTSLSVYPHTEHCAKSAKEAQAAAWPISMFESQLCHAAQLEVMSCRDVSQSNTSNERQSHPWATTVFFPSVLQILYKR